MKDMKERYNTFRMKRVLESIIRCCDAPCARVNDPEIMDSVLKDIRSKAVKGLDTSPVKHVKLDVQHIPGLPL